MAPRLSVRFFADLMPSALSCMFSIFLYLISILLFSKDWERFHSLLYRLPFAIPVSNAGRRILQCVKSWIHAQFRIMAVISLECMIGYYFLHIPGFPFWAVLTGIIDALPVFGTGTVFFPWIVIVALQGDYTLALWLGLLYLTTWLTPGTSGTETPGRRAGAFARLFPYVRRRRTEALRASGLFLRSLWRAPHTGTVGGAGAVLLSEK